jgi:group I intron endonuclease
MKFNIEEFNANKSGVYIIKNSIDSRVYVGSAIYLYKRFFEHRRTLLKNNHANTHLQRFANKYGVDCLTFEVLEFCCKDTLLVKEQFWLDYHNSYNREYGFNIRIKAKSNLGITFTLSESRKQQLSNLHKGRKHTQEARNKMAEAKRGKMPPDSRINININTLKIANEKRKISVVISNVLYPSLKEAAIALNTSPQNIANRCKNVNFENYKFA